KVEHLPRAGDRLGETCAVAHVRTLDTDPVAVPLPEPAQVLLDPGSGKAVVDQDGTAASGEPIREIGADETRAAGDQDRTVRRAGGSHATSPRRASSSVA